MQDETVWLSQQQMADLFQTSRTNIVEHIKHIYAEDELDEASTCRKFRQVRKEGNREVSRELPYYNLDMIISLGYSCLLYTSLSDRHDLYGQAVLEDRLQAFRCLVQHFDL